MKRSEPHPLHVSVIGISDDAMGLIRAAIRTESQLPMRAAPYAAGSDDVVCRESGLVLIGLDEDRKLALELAQKLIRQNAEIRLIGISLREERLGVLEALRAGLSEYLLLPRDAETLRRSIHPRHLSEMSHPGNLIAILGSKGGCGVSTISVHLAAQLATMHRVCAVDMDFGMGDVAALLSLEPESSIQALLSNLAELNQRSLLRSVSVHPSHVHVLPQPSFPEDPQNMSRSDLRSTDVLHLLDLLRDGYQHIFLDCSGALDLPTLCSLREADQIWLICTPDVLSVRNTWRRLRLLDQMGIARDRVRLIVNRWREGAPLSLDDIENNLEVAISGKIREDRATVEQAATRGVLIRQLNEHSPFHLDIAQCASLIVQAAARQSRS